MPRTQVTGEQIENGSLTSEDIANGSILAEDLNPQVLQEVADQVEANLQTSGMMTVNTHRNLGTLVHNLADNLYVVNTRENGFISKVEFFADVEHTIKVRDEEYTRSGGFISTETIRQYVSGQVDETLVKTYNRVSGFVSSEDWSLV